MEATIIILTIHIKGLVKKQDEKQSLNIILEVSPILQRWTMKCYLDKNTIVHENYYSLQNCFLIFNEPQTSTLHSKP